MFERLRALLEGAEARNQGPRDDAELRIATAVLLVEAACTDGEFDEREEAVIRALLARHFNLSEAEIAALMESARAAQDKAAGMVRYTRIIKERFSEEERISMIEMLWEVAYADGVLDDYEANLLRRIGGLLYVPDRETGLARQRVLDRLGIKD